MLCVRACNSEQHLEGRGSVAAASTGRLATDGSESARSAVSASGFSDTANDTVLLSASNEGLLSEF